MSVVYDLIPQAWDEKFLTQLIMILIMSSVHRTPGIDQLITHNELRTIPNYDGL